MYAWYPRSAAGIDLQNSKSPAMSEAHKFCSASANKQSEKVSERVRETEGGKEKERKRGEVNTNGGLI